MTQLRHEKPSAFLLVGSVGRYARSKFTMRRFIYILMVVGVATLFSHHASFAASAPPKAGKPQPELYVYLSGGVRKPGRYAWTKAMTLVDAVDAAGGFTEGATRKVWIHHFDGASEYYTRGSTNAPPRLGAGDRISVPERLI